MQGDLKIYELFREIADQVKADGDYPTEGTIIGNLTVRYDGVIIVSVLGSRALIVAALHEAFNYVIPRATLPSSLVEVSYQMSGIRES